MKITWLPGLLLALFVAMPGHAQPTREGVLQGVVWQAPESLARAEAQLRAMRRTGVEAVRTGPIQRERLLTLADTLGLAFFQDLPVVYLSAGALRDTLGFLEQTLSRMLVRGQGHSSAQYFGLARLSDTSDPDACRALAQLAKRVETAGRRPYYLTPFIEADVCADVVDLVLLGALDVSDPAVLLARWRVAHPDTSASGVGLGAVGIWVVPEAEHGLRAAHSLESQARYFEQHLSSLVSDTSGGSPAAVFVYRWQDASGNERALPGRHYGLHTADGSARPALEVVRGIFTGERHVFAFSQGAAPFPEVPWLVLLGWGVLTLLGAFYAGEPRFRRMIPRYFRARGFYREAVREGREVLIGASVVLLVAVSLGTGMLVAAFFEAVRVMPSFQLILTVLTPQGRLDAFMMQPWLLVPVGATLYAVGLVLWAMLLAFVSQRWMPLYLSQTLMLAVWPRWPMLMLMLGAVVASTYAPSVAVPLLAILGAFWLLTALVACARALYDYVALTRCPAYVALALAVASPLFVGVVGAVIWALSRVQTLPFLWHLLTRT